MNSINQIGLHALEKLDEKNYLHFDFPLTENEREQLISDFSSGNIVHHRYLPFISFEIRFHIYHTPQKTDPKSCSKKKADSKSRKITLPSHHDALVYRYYGAVLNHLYSNYAIEHNFSKIAVAYREHQSGKHLSNITTAKEVFDYVTLFPKAWIIKGDFHHFFDTLNHQHLIDNLLKVFGRDLPNDWKRMLRSITQYQSISRKTLERQLHVAKVKTAYRSQQSEGSRSRAYVNDLQELGKLIKGKKIRLSGKNRVGIPQGTAVSAVLANVYMVDFDEWLAKRCKKFGGLYRRYSDDFILVLPQNQLSKASVKNFEAEIIEQSQDILHLNIEPTKTKLYSYEQDRHAVILLPNDEMGRQKLGKIDYLGFIFDGVSVSMRPKSIYKFVYRGRRKIGKYITLLRLRSKVKAGFSDSDIIQSQVVLRYVTHFGNTKRDYVSPPLSSAIQSLRSLQQIKEMKPETLQGIHKGITIRYLSTEVKKPRSSMLGYALRAQHTFDVDRPKYRVVIRRQVLRQIKRNQRKLHQGRKKYNS